MCPGACGSRVGCTAKLHCTFQNASLDVSSTPQLLEQPMGPHKILKLSLDHPLQTTCPRGKWQFGGHFHRICSYLCAQFVPALLDPQRLAWLFISTSYLNASSESGMLSQARPVCLPSTTVRGWGLCLWFTPAAPAWVREGSSAGCVSSVSSSLAGLPTHRHPCLLSLLPIIGWCFSWRMRWLVPSACWSG